MPGAESCKVVIFDFDGTLADTWRDIATALNRTLEQAGLPAASGPDVRFGIGEGALVLLERAVPEDRRDEAYVAELYERFRDQYDRCCLDTTETYAGVAECLDALAYSELAVLSNKPSRFLDRVIDGLGLKDRFRVVAGGDTLPARKPDPAAVAHLLGRMDVEPTDLWMVGDSAIDVLTGKGAGARTIGCAWGLRGREELRGAGVDYLVESPREIPAIVSRL